MFQSISRFVHILDCPTSKELTFHINYPEATTPYITVTKGLLKDRVIPDGWVQTGALSFHSDTCYDIYQPDTAIDAYSWLIEQVHLGKQEHFVTTPVLRESWVVWGQVIDNIPSDSPEMRKYPPGWNKNVLDLNWDESGITFANECSNSSDIITVQPWMNGKLKYGSTNSIIDALAYDLVDAIALKANKDFHLALSGGSSPVLLFKILSSVATGVIPWQRVHIWQVDERCDVTTESSNFVMICKYLVDNIKEIKFHNIHPMIKGTF